MNAQSLSDLMIKEKDTVSAESEHTLQLLLNGIKEYAVCILDRNGNITRCNEGDRRLKGYGQNEILGKHFSVLYRPEDITNAKLLSVLHRAKENGVYEEAGWIVKKNGTAFWANILITAVYKEDGMLEAFAHTVHDISSLKKLQEENNLLKEKLEEKTKNLEKSEARLTAIIENAGELIWSVDKKGRLNAFNKAFVKWYSNLYKKSPEQKKILYDFLSDENKEESAYFYKRALQGEKAVFERTIPINGTSRHLIISLHPIMVNNEVTGISCYAFDQSEKVIAERKMKNYAEQLSKTAMQLDKVFTYSVDMICSLDSEARCIYVSKASEAILGYKPEELMGQKLIELVPADDIKKTIKAREKIKSGISVTNFQNNCYRKDGSVVCITWSAYWSPEEQTMFCVGRDATEQKSLEKALRNEQERFTDLFLQAPLSICILKGETHVYEMVNPLYIQTFGKKDIIGKTVKQAFPEVEEQGFLELLDNVYKTGKSFSGNEILVKVNRNGDRRMSDIYLNFIYQAYRNSESKIEGIFFFATDVTEQVQARKKIEESKKKYSDLIQNLPAAIYTSDAKGRIMLYNKAATNLWGSEPAVGEDFWCKDCKTYRADGTLMPIDTSPMILTLMEERPIFGEEIIVENTTGVCSHVLPYSTPSYDLYGNLAGAVNMLIDITERKKAEEKLKTSNDRFEIVIKATNDAIWDWNLVTGDVYYNTSYSRIFGYPGNSAAQNFDQLIEKIHPADRDRVKNSIVEKINKSDTTNWQDEYRYIKANGEIAEVLNRGFLLIDDQKKPVRFVGAMQDITDRKKNEIEKEYLINKLTHSYRDLQQFTYITSHNLRAPLSNLIGLIDNIDYQTLNDFNKKILDMFRTSTQQLNQTINDLNQILIIKNNARLEIQNINIAEVFNNVCTYFTDDIEKLSVSLHTVFDCEEIPFNKSYLESVLTNLISNAIKYRSPKRKLALKITTKREKTGYVSLTFSDNGIGIDLKRNKDKIFGLYQRFHSNASGTGFGLFITKTQITSFGGTMEVVSEVDKGTTFYISLRERSQV